MNPMYRVKIPQPKRVHVLLSKACGGFMVFWMLWRGYHDWPMLFVSVLICSLT